MNFWSAPKRMVALVVIIGLIVLGAQILRLNITSDPETWLDIEAYLIGAITGIMGGFTVILLTITAAAPLSSRLYGVRRLPKWPARTLTYALTRRWTLQSPIHGLSSPPMLVIPESTEPDTIGPYLRTLAFPQVVLAIIGVAGYLISLFAVQDPWKIGISAGMSFTIALSSCELIPYRSASYTTIGGLIRWLRRELDAFPQFIGQNRLAIVEYCSPERPREWNAEQIADLHAILDDQSTWPCLRICSARLLYFAAIDHQDAAVASAYIRYLHYAIQDPAILPNNRRAIELLFAFHSAWVDRNWPAAQAWLTEVGTTKAMRNTPIYLITDALIAYLRNDYQSAAKRLKIADKRARQFKVVSGMTRYWLDVIDAAYLSLPFELQPRGKRRQVHPLVLISNPEQATEQPQAA